MVAPAAIILFPVISSLLATGIQSGLEKIINKDSPLEEEYPPANYPAPPVNQDTTDVTNANSDVNHIVIHNYPPQHPVPSVNPNNSAQPTLNTNLNLKVEDVIKYLKTQTPPVDAREEGVVNLAEMMDFAQKIKQNKQGQRIKRQAATQLQQVPQELVELMKQCCTRSLPLGDLTPILSEPCCKKAKLFEE